LTTISDVQINGSFTAPVSVPDGYIVLRKAGAFVNVTDEPVDYATYIAGNTINGATVVAVLSHPTVNFSAMGLTAATAYTFRVYAFNGTAPGSEDYYLTDVLEGSKSTFDAEPGAQPSGLNLTTVSTTEISGIFTAAAGPPDSYIVLRKDGVFTDVTDEPVDGVGYSAGNTIGGATVAAVLADPTVSFNATSLTDNIVYNFRIYSFNGSVVTANYKLTSPATGSQTTYAEQPIEQPSGLNLTTISDVQIDGSFTAPVSVPDGYIVLRKAGAFVNVTDEPVDYATYTSGNTINGATVVEVLTHPNVNFSGGYSLQFSGICIQRNSIGFRGLLFNRRSGGKRNDF
jgi:hypothetical protein